MKIIVRYCLLLLACWVVTGSVVASPRFAAPIEGRWDLTVNMDGKELPSWLEVVHLSLIHI